MYKTIKYIIVFTLLVTTSLFAYNLKGIVLDVETNEPLQGANIQIFEEEKYTFSDNEGYFTVRNLNTETVSVKVSYIGYKSQSMEINLKKSAQPLIKFLMEPSLIKFEAVRVTITKSEKALSSSSLPITFIDDRTINQKLPLGVSEAIATEPGISLSSDGIWGKTIAIRGLSKNNIVMLIDGNRISTATNLAAALSLVDINDVERIETIKSGASSLYGSGATGGVINIVTKQAYYNDNFYLKPSLKTGFHSVNNMLYENLNIITGAKKWNLKLALQNRTADDAETPKETLENSQFEDQNLSATFNIIPIENHEISLIYQNFQAENVGLPGGKPLFPAKADVRYVEAYRELYSIKYEIKNLLPALPKISMKIYQQNIFRDVENVPHIINVMPTTPVKEAHVLKITPNALHETTGFQLRSNWLPGLNNFLTVGLEGWQKELRSRRQKHIDIHILNNNNETVKTIEQIVGELPLPNSTYRTAGLFFNDDQYLMNKKLILNFGGRVDMVTIESDAVSNPDYLIVDGVRNDNPPTQTLFWEAEDDKDYSWSANFGILYKPVKYWSVKLNLSKSFRSPTLEERFNYIDLGSLIELGNPELNSEISFAKDLGIKFVKDDLSLGVNLFHNSMSDLVVEKSGDYNGTPALIKTNAGEAVLYGYELFGNAGLPHNFSITSNISYVYAKDTKNNEPLALIPPLNGQLALHYRYKNLLNFSAEMNAFAKQDRITDWELETPGYAYFNFTVYTNNLNFFRTTHQFFFRVDNINDKAYRNHLSTNRGAMVEEPGRNFGISWKIGL